MERKNYFNKMAETWDELFNNKELSHFLVGFVPKFGLKQGQKILDAGTGTGILIPFLLKAVGPTGHVTAVDYAEKMIEVCKSKFSLNQNITFKTVDIGKLSLPPESFDAAICFGLFPHLDHKGQALNQLNRVLKVQGKLIIAHALSSVEIKSHHANLSPVVALDVMPTEQKMKQMLNKTGFGRIHVTDKHRLYLCVSTKSKSATIKDN